MIQKQISELSLVFSFFSLISNYLIKLKIEIIYINKYYTKWKLYLLPKKYKTQLT